MDDRARMPTTDGGFWRLRHDDLAVLLAWRGANGESLSWSLARVFLALADLTLGWGKKADIVSLSQIADHAGMFTLAPDESRQPDCSNVAHSLKALERLGLAGRTKGKGQHVLRWVVWPVGKTTVGVNSGATVGVNSETTVGATVDPDRHLEDQEKRRGENGIAAPGFGRGRVGGPGERTKTKAVVDQRQKDAQERATIEAERQATETILSALPDARLQELQAMAVAGAVNGTMAEAFRRGDYRTAPRLRSAMARIHQSQKVQPCQVGSGPAGDLRLNGSLGGQGVGAGGTAGES